MSTTASGDGTSPVNPDVRVVNLRTSTRESKLHLPKRIILKRTIRRSFRARQVSGSTYALVDPNHGTVATFAVPANLTGSNLHPVKVVALRFDDPEMPDYVMLDMLLEVRDANQG